MKFLELIAEKWNLVYGKVAPVVSAIAYVLSRAGDILLKIWQTILKFRKIFLAAPVVWAAVQLAFQNLERLPDTVGLDVQLDGTYAIQISRELACWGPVVLTIFCLLMMFCSRRILTPWLVSVMTLILPIFIWIINVFPS